MISKLDNLFLDKGVYQVVKKILDHWFLKLLIILLTSFNAYVLFVLGNDKQAEKFKDNFKLPAEFVLNNAGSVVIFTVIFTGIYGLFYAFINKKCSNLEKQFNDLTEQHRIVLVILEKLETVVVAKRQRFAGIANRYANTPGVQRPKHKTVFDGITRPDVQIQLLIEGLRDCLNSIYQNETIKVALMRVVDSKLDNWVCHSPYDSMPKSTVADLRHPNSTFSMCIAKDKMIIVPDTHKELSKRTTSDIMFVKGKSDTSEKWCQVCAPIHSINTNEIIYIISIAIKRENVIVAENSDYLNWLLKFFKSRLALEHSLDQLKKKVS